MAISSLDQSVFLPGIFLSITALTIYQSLYRIFVVVVFFFFFFAFVFFLISLISTCAIGYVGDFVASTMFISAAGMILIFRETFMTLHIAFTVLSSNLI